MKSWNAFWRRWRSRADRTIPTPRAAVTVVIAAVAVFVSGSYALCAMLAVILVALLGFDVWMLRHFGVPDVERKVDSQPQMGVPTGVLISVAWRSNGLSRWLATALYTRAGQLEMDDGRPASFQLLSPRTSTASNWQWIWRETVVPTRRGPAEWGAVDSRWHSPLGLWARLHRSEAHERVLVLPDVTTWRKDLQALQQTLFQEGRHVRRLASGDTDFSHIADHSIDDDPRHVNWAATVRKGRLMRNVYQPERGQHLILAIDASRYMGVELPDGKTRLDYALECASALAKTAVDLGDSVGVIAFTNEILLNLPPGKGTNHWRKLVLAFAGVETQPVQGGYHMLYKSLTGRFQRRSLLVLFSELEGISADVNFLRFVSASQRRHPTLFVSVADVQAQQVLERVPASEKDLAEWAAAEWVLHNRALAVQHLSRQGIDVVESPPGQLVIHVVGEYLKRKRKFAL